MVTNLAAKGSNATITASWSHPVSEYLAGIAVVYNDDHMPEKPSDGTKVDAGLAETVDLTGLTNGTLYYIRVFPYNAKKQYQTLLNGATTSATPNIGPAQVTNFQVTGSGSSPVLTWTNPTDDLLYHETVVIQKVGSAPTSLTDGTEIYRGTGTTVTASGLVRLEEYYFAVFTIDEAGSHRSPVVSEMYSYDFPDEPTSYSEIEKLYSTTQWQAPEDGYFEFIGLAKSGDGARGNQGSGAAASGGSGGSGGITVTRFALYKDDIVSINVSGNVSINYKEETANAIAGGNGSTGSLKYSGVSVTGAYGGGGGKAGSANGGNVNNINGVEGNNGDGNRHGTVDSTVPSVSNSYQGYTTTSGKGSITSIQDGVDWNSGKSYLGTAAYVVILRGNTNIPSPSAASTLSLLPTDGTLTVDWTNSGDPVQTGTMLVYNANHAPTSENDGVSVDIPAAQAAAATFAADGEEQQTDTKKQSYAITGLTNNKPVYVALFPYDANKKYGIPKTDVEIPREHSWYDTQQELKQEVQEATEQAEQAQEAVTMTRDFLPDAIALTMPQIYDEWDPNGITYTGKDKATEENPAAIVRRNGKLYRCLQSHTSQENWKPETSPSLWVEIADPALEWPEWKQPTGAHDAYDLNAKVSHNGKKWISQIAANTTEPGADERYWKEYTE